MSACIGSSRCGHFFFLAIQHESIQQEVSMDLKPDQVLDCSGLACPMPILKTKKAVDALQVGQVLELIATDPGSVSDMNAWTQKTGHQLLGSEQQNGKFVFLIKKTK
jgi:tRNA 2-thiouridine synthesizing protein A